MGFLGVYWTIRHLDAHRPPSYSWGQPLEPLKLLSKPTRKVACYVGLGSHCALPGLHGIDLASENSEGGCRDNPAWPGDWGARLQTES